MKTESGRSIIVAARSGWPLLSHFFSYLLPNLRESDEIIIVLDGVSDIHVHKSLSKISAINSAVKVVVNESPLGYSLANNKGVSFASGENLIFLNTDVFVTKNALNEISNALEQRSGIVQGLLVYPQNGRVQSAGHVFGNNINRHLFRGRKPSWVAMRSDSTRQGVTSAFYTMKKSVFEKNNGFDPMFHNCYDGLELSIRVAKSGYECTVCPEATAFHIQGGTRNKLSITEAQSGAIFWRRWGDHIKNDHVKCLQSQLERKMMNKTFLTISFSSYLSWPNTLNQLGIKYDWSITDEETGDHQVSLFTRVSSNIRKQPGPILFLTDYYLNISQNQTWHETRPNKCDVVADLHGNLGYVSDLL